jgi:hypothetical protein
LPVDWESKIRDGAPDADVAEKVILGIRSLFERDGSLLIRRVNERTITALLACHLRPLFAGWQVDCEFNRDYKNARDIKMIGEKRVVPDIIIHHRCAPEVGATLDPSNHCLAVEVKQSVRDHPNSVSDIKDMEKLTGFRRVHGYQNALFLKFISGSPNLGLWSVRWIAG